ncbi:Rab-like protein 2A [Boothiomyces macroporosus]|uniref:Rab-like protein 2A n=1 Tax=Boothiomyces macroporosus TaxID=261099 RepID=A0AAD5UKW0_9FUNG|nr:Rab-like protein 2A [Boothiomyces macroporosus]
MVFVVHGGIYANAGILDYICNVQTRKALWELINKLEGIYAPKIINSKFIFLYAFMKDIQKVEKPADIKNLDTWYEELVSHRGIKMPVIVVANKIDMDPSRATKSFAFVEKRRIERGGNEQDLPFYFVSASDGSNVVTIFKEAIARATTYKEDLASGKAGTFVDEVLQFIKEEEQRPDGLFKTSVAPVS